MGKWESVRWFLKLNSQFLHSFSFLFVRLHLTIQSNKYYQLWVYSIIIRNYLKRERVCARVCVCVYMQLYVYCMYVCMYVWLCFQTVSIPTPISSSLQYSQAHPFRFLKNKWRKKERKKTKTTKNIKCCKWFSVCSVWCVAFLSFCVSVFLCVHFKNVNSNILHNFNNKA